MISRRIFTLSLFKSILKQSTPLINFSQNSWKQRQESAEKYYISNKQKKTLSSLLHKIEEQQANFDAKQSEFQEKLRKIVSRHKIQNQNAFIAEVINLHKNL